MLLTQSRCDPKTQLHLLGHYDQSQEENGGRRLLAQVQQQRAASCWETGRLCSAWHNQQEALRSYGRRLSPLLTSPVVSISKSVTFIIDLNIMTINPQEPMKV